LNIDESPTKEGPAKAWVWTFVAATYTVFVCATSRAAAVARNVLGDEYDGIIHCDRARMYWCFGRLQWCWVHLVRDVQAEYETTGPGRPIGNARRCFAEDVFTDWYRVRDGTLERSTFRQYRDRQRPWLRARLDEGAACGSPRPLQKR
jgi:transposase